MFHPNPPLLWMLACLLGALLFGTGIRVALIHGQPNQKPQSHLNSLRSWWVLTLVLFAAVLMGQLGVAILLAAVGSLALREFVRLIGWKRIGLPSACIVFGIVPVYYMLLLFGFAEQMRTMAPLLFLIALGSVRAVLGLTEDFIRTTAALVWGLMLFVFCLSHAYFLADSSGLPVPWVGELGWFLYLVILTESNDIAQALIGRSFGRTKISPRTSPNKSLEGLVGGMVFTSCLATLLSPWLTSFMQKSWFSGFLLSLVSGLLIATFGFLGDLNKSGIKRDIGIKDSGTMLPGQGGMMDRVDSLTFSAPVFFYFNQLTSFLS